MSVENNLPFEDYSGELEEARWKLEESQTRLRSLKILADDAVRDYDILRQAFSSSQSECSSLALKLLATETRLKELECALEPACEEFGQLKKNYKIEKECRFEAEKYAAKMRKQYGNLKRQSQNMLLKLQLVSFEEEEPDGSVDVGGNQSPAVEDVLPGAGDREALNVKIQAQDATISDLRHKLKHMEDDKLTAYHREMQLFKQVCELRDTLDKETKREASQVHTIKNIKRVSQMAVEEYESLQARYEQEAALRCEAERFAHVMLSERDAVKRESSLVLSSACADERLASALMAVEDLMVQLEAEKLFHKQTRQALQDSLNASDLRKQVADLEVRLEIASSDNERLHRAVMESENWKKKVEKENVDLINKLDVCEQRLRPAPPPPAPPPPPILFSPLQRLFKIRKTNACGSTSSGSAGNKKESPREQTYEQALLEMMDRIKSGRALKAIPMKQSTSSDNIAAAEEPSRAQLLAVPSTVHHTQATQWNAQLSVPETKEESAINNLHQLLSGLKSRQMSVNRTDSECPRNNTNSSSGEPPSFGQVTLRRCASPVGGTRNQQPNLFNNRPETPPGAQKEFTSIGYDPPGAPRNMVQRSFGSPTTSSESIQLCRSRSTARDPPNVPPSAASELAAVFKQRGLDANKFDNEH